MDTFFEQIIKIKNTAKTYLGYFLISLLAIILILIGILFLRSVLPIVVLAVGFGAFKLYSMLNVEYEYIITNSSFDIDKIVAKSSRKRIFSFDLISVIRVEKYNKGLPEDLIKGAFFACNESDEDAVVIVIQPEGKAKQSIIIAPNDRMRSAMKKFLPKHIGDNLQ
ncbi:MAG: DUF6106 family protein [Clostridia bacterium]|nr:DUF6106 family protein [Clostridia bacterium]